MKLTRVIAVSGILLLGSIVSSVVVLQPAIAAEQDVGSFQDLQAVRCATFSGKADISDARLGRLGNVRFWGRAKHA